VKIGSYVVQKGKKIEQVPTEGEGWENLNPIIFLTMGVHNSSVKQKKIRFSTKILRDYIWHQTSSLESRVNFLLIVIELLFLSLTADALQGKTCQNSLFFLEGVGQFERSFQGKGSSLGNIFLVSRKLDAFCYLIVQTALCYVQSF